MFEIDYNFGQNEAYIIGGVDSKENFISQCEVYNFKTQ